MCLELLADCAVLKYSHIFFSAASYKASMHHIASFIKFHWPALNPSLDRPIMYPANDYRPVLQVCLLPVVAAIRLTEEVLFQMGPDTCRNNISPLGSRVESHQDVPARAVDVAEEGSQLPSSLRVLDCRLKGQAIHAV
ncbi:hypothetical protein BT96DRAFT_397096 [Gymnopus androsaceus JB14]|uniref:Uncharacterized protein n=1 Tax=Gymnopus androsaceus JB14 TaxID=1447944 RepID=A0A6A4I832_9AGAR|nr:hypothetical protein BT96DRAFT_397096 [Gymnopus androsaceus JB14]